MNMPKLKLRRLIDLREEVGERVRKQQAKVALDREAKEEDEKHKQQKEDESIGAQNINDMRYDQLLKRANLPAEVGTGLIRQSMHSGRKNLVLLAALADFHKKAAAKNDDTVIPDAPLLEPAVPQVERVAQQGAPPA